MTEQVKKFISQYEKATADMLFLVEEGCLGAVVEGKYCLPCVKFLASYNPATKELSEETGFLDWITRENRRRSGWGHHFRALKVYRVRVSRFIPSDSDENTKASARKGNRYRIVKVLGRPLRCTLFEGVKERYLTPVVIQSPIYGAFTLDRRFDTFRSTVEHGGSEVTIELTADTPEGETADRALDVLHRLYPDIAASDERLKKYAAENMTESANDWSECDITDSAEGESGNLITEAEFASRITLCLVTVSSDGSASFWYDDDGMFYSHTIVIDTDSEGAPSEPYLMG